MASDLAVLLVDQRLDQFHNPLLSSSGSIKSAAHLGEPAVNLLEPAVNLLEFAIDVTPQIDEVLPKGVEARRRRTTKIADLASYLGDVAVGRAGQHSGCRGVLFGRLQPPPDVVGIVPTHSEKITAGANAAFALSAVTGGIGLLCADLAADWCVGVPARGHRLRFG